MTSCLVIDDVDVALRRMSPLGRSLVAPAAERIREAVLSFAARRGWGVVAHDRFAEWARERHPAGDEHLYVLDPLILCDDGGSRESRLRVRRVLEGPGAVSRLRWDDHAPNTRPGDSSVLDDAASSGRTILGVIAHLAARGATVRGVALCAASSAAQETVRRAHRDVRWDLLHPGDWRVIHLRDGCPFLPFSGRPTGAPPVEVGEARSLEPRALAVSIPGNLWQVLYLDRTVRAAVDDAPLAITNAFVERYGRPLTTTDIAHFGPDVPLTRTASELSEPADFEPRSVV